MKHLLLNLGINLVALLCIGIAGWMASKQLDGWGWFLFVGMLCAGSTVVGKKDT